MKKAIELAADYVFRVVEAICKVVLVFMVFTVAAQVFTRLLGGNIKWCEEIMLLLLDALMFLLMPIGIKEDLHIRIEVLARHFKLGARRALVVFSDIVQLMISVCMIYYGKVLMDKTHSVFTITGIPRKYLYTITVVGGVLCAFIVVLKIFGLCRAQSTIDFINGGVKASSKELRGEANT